MYIHDKFDDMTFCFTFVNSSRYPILAQIISEASVIDIKVWLWYINQFEDSKSPKYDLKVF